MDQLSQVVKAVVMKRLHPRGPEQELKATYGPVTPTPTPTGHLVFQPQSGSATWQTGQEPATICPGLTLEGTRSTGRVPS